MNLKITSISLFVLLISICSINSQQWQQLNGPYGGSVRAFLSEGPFIYAGCSPGGVYRSSNNGSSWQPVNEGIDRFDLDIRSLVSHNGKIYAGSINGLYTSTNSGINWNKDLLFPNSSVSSLMSSGDHIFAGTPSGVYISANNGASWILSTNGLTNTDINCIALKGTDILAGTLYGLFRSTNNGNSWNRTDNGITHFWINDIAVLGNDIYAATAGGRIFRSTNNGAAWFSSSVGIISSNVTALEVYGDTLISGDHGNSIYYSTNNGTDWEFSSINNELNQAPIILEIKKIGNILFAGLFGDGVLKSTDAGMIFDTSNAGLNANTVSSVIFFQDMMFAGTDKRIFSSTDRGLTWQLSTIGIQCTYIFSFAVEGSDLFAGAGGGCGVYHSSNGGSLWNNINTGLENTYVKALLSYGGSIFAGTEGGIFKTTNKGQFWIPVNSGIGDLNITCLDQIDGVIFAANLSGIYRSTNLGGNWIYSSSGIPQNSYIRKILKHNNSLFAATAVGVFMSSNNGTSWVARNSGIQTPSANAIASIGSNLVVAAINGIYFSSNNGTNWFPMNNGINALSQVFAATDSILFAGTYGSGMYRFESNLIAVSGESEVVPKEFRLYNNYPNPFNPATIIKFDIPKDALVKVRVYDILGKQIYSLNEFKKAGSYDLQFNGSGIASGMYFYSVEANGFKETKKMVLLK